MKEFGNIARTSNTVVIPATLSDVGGMITAAMNVLKAATPAEPVRNTSVVPPRPPPPRTPGFSVTNSTSAPSRSLSTYLRSL